MLRGHDTQRVYISLSQQHMECSVLVPVTVYVLHQSSVPTTSRGMVYLVSQYYQVESIPVLSDGEYPKCLESWLLVSYVLTRGGVHPQGVLYHYVLWCMYCQQDMHTPNRAQQYQYYSRVETTRGRGAMYRDSVQLQDLQVVRYLDMCVSVVRCTIPECPSGGRRPCEMESRGRDIQ